MYPPGVPWKDVALVGAFWNCAERAERLLTAMRPWFETISIAVQDSPDNTLEVVRSIADITVPDKWHGHGNASFQKAISAVYKHRWCFLVSDDEMPEEQLLASMQEILDWLNSEKNEGAWFHFHSTIEGFEFTREQDNHLRLFQTRWGWPPTIHSRPMIPQEQTGFWPHGKGCIHHDRSLDEMARDYIRRYEIGRGHQNWDAHNKRMLRSACSAVGRLKGVEFVKSHEWWPEAERIAFDSSPIEDSVGDARMGEGGQRRLGMATTRRSTTRKAPARRTTAAAPKKAPATKAAAPKKAPAKKTAAPKAAPLSGRIELEPLPLRANEQLSITGTGLPPSAQVRVTILPEGTNSGARLLKTDPFGQVQTHIYPKAGEHTVIFEMVGGGRIQRDFVVAEQ